jgi:hypothetical protein
MPCEKISVAEVDKQVITVENCKQNEFMRKSNSGKSIAIKSCDERRIRKGPPKINPQQPISAFLTQTIALHPSDTHERSSAPELRGVRDVRPASFLP